LTAPRGFVLQLYVAAALASLAGLLIASPVFADLGPCHTDPPTNLHQKGDESHTNIWGAYAEIVVRNPDLCNTPPTVNGGSASTGYVMTWRPQGAGDVYDNWLQIGYVEIPGTSPHWYMQYSDGNNIISDDVGCTTADPCVNSGIGTRYRLVIKHLTSPEQYYHLYVLRNSDAALTWTSTDPTVAELGFTPSIVQYASEAVDRGDQSGGGNASRMVLDTFRWYETSALTIRTPDIQGAERICNMCGAAGPYNINWLSGSGFEVWTDGF
jgi:hypothetical protein